MSREFKLFIINLIRVQKIFFTLILIVFLSFIFSIFFNFPKWMDVIIIVINCFLISDFKKIFPYNESIAFDLPFSRLEIALYSMFIASLISLCMVVMVVFVGSLTDLEISPSSQSLLSNSDFELILLTVFFTFIGYCLTNSKLRLDSQWRLRTFVFYTRMFFAVGIMAFTIENLASPQYKNVIVAAALQLILIIFYLINHFGKQLHNEHLEYKKRLFNPIVDFCIIIAFVSTAASSPSGISGQKKSEAGKVSKEISVP